MASCFQELDVDVPEITPGPRTRGRTTGPALLWRRLAFTGLEDCCACTPYIISRRRCEGGGARRDTRPGNPSGGLHGAGVASGLSV